MTQGLSPTIPPLDLTAVVEKTGCRIFGSDLVPKMSFHGVAPLDRAEFESLSFLANEKYFDQAKDSRAGAIFCHAAIAEQLASKNTTAVLLVCADPYAAFAKISQHFFRPVHPFSGISPLAVVDQSACIDPTATIFPFAFVGPGAHVGARSVVYSGCFIGAASRIGEDCILYPNVVIREGCLVADRCLLNPGAVLGGEGFGFAGTPEENVKIPHIGGVVLADDVEVGSNATIDRGSLKDTKIGRQTKIDNLVMVAHNAEIGELCFLAAQVGVAGSAIIGNRCWVGGQAGIGGHVRIGDGVMVGGQAGVSKNIPLPGVWQGTPARPQKEFYEEMALLKRVSAREKLSQKKHRKGDPS